VGLGEEVSFGHFEGWACCALSGGAYGWVATIQLYRILCHDRLSANAACSSVKGYVQAIHVHSQIMTPSST
jgi:hypothetical protein